MPSLVLRVPALLAWAAFALPLSAQPGLGAADSAGAAADSLAEAGAYAEAEVAALEAVRLTEAAVGPDDVRLADRLSTLAYLIEGGGAVQEAEPLYARALSIAEAAPGQPGLGDHLVNLGLARQALGDHERANPLFERAVAVFERDGDPVAAAESSFNLGLGLFYIGAFSEAAPHYERASAVFERELGPDHPDLAYPLTGLARLDHQRGAYAAARAGYERAVSLREMAFGPDHPAVANDRNELAWLLVDIGDYAEAARIAARVAGATDSVPGAEAVLSRALFTLGVARSEMGQRAGAGTAFERALEVREAGLGPDHPAVAQVLAEKAALADRAGDLDRAAELYRRAVGIREAALGTDHPNVAATLDRIAWIEARLGTTDLALANARRALAIWDSSLPTGHPSTALSRSGLASVLHLANRETEAEPLYLASNADLTAHARTTLPDLAWAEQRAFLNAVLRGQSGAVLSAFAGSSRLSEAYADLAQWKGLLLQGLRRQAVLARLSDDGAGDRVRALADVRTKIAAWFQRAGTLPLREWASRNDSLNTLKEGLERALATSLPADALVDPLGSLIDRGGTDAFQSRLPARTAFVDVYRYDRRLSADSVAASYGAVVTTPNALSFVSLGRADDVDAAVDAWRMAAVRGRAGDDMWERVASAVWAPLAAALPAHTEGVWVSPDGALGRLPWSLLPEDGLAVSIVDSARELVLLLDRPSAPAGETVVLAVGDVDFGEGFRFKPLPATAGEVSALRTLADGRAADVVTLTGAGATSEALRQRLPAATHVHLATHGVFVDDAVLAEPGTWARSPLVESGLALAGANESPSGVLTAETLVGVDQTGTDLVVLSACETGLGTEVDGQGVMGLRAAFTTAGARSVLMSLWRVPDESTAALMRHFYRALWVDGLPVGQALRAAQDAVRAEPATSAPLHWAGWLVVGQAW